jgi:hypothetical protein
VLPPRSLDLMPLNVIWGYIGDQVYNHRVNRLDDLKAQITTATACVTMGML